MLELKPSDIKWSQDIVVKDAMGRDIKAYDDVKLLQPVTLNGAVRSDATCSEIGWIGTILFISEGPDPILDLEIYIPESDGFAFGNIAARYVQLHKTTEEKWPENYVDNK